MDVRLTFFSTSLKRREERLLFSVLAASSPKADFPPHPPLVRTDDTQRQLAEISRGISCWTGDSWRVWFAILVAVHSGGKNNNPRPFPGSLRTSFYGRTSCRISVSWYVVEQVVGTFGGKKRKAVQDPTRMFVDEQHILSVSGVGSLYFFQTSRCKLAVPSESPADLTVTLRVCTRFA